MKLSNFELIKIEHKSLGKKVFYAEIDVTTRTWFFKKKTTRKKIYREFPFSWVFVDTGEYVPVLEVDALYRAWQARTGRFE